MYKLINEISIIVGGRFHAFNLAEQLNKKIFKTVNYKLS